MMNYSLPKVDKVKIVFVSCVVHQTKMPRVDSAPSILVIEFSRYFVVGTVKCLRIQGATEAIGRPLAVISIQDVIVCSLADSTTRLRFERVDREGFEVNISEVYYVLVSIRNNNTSAAKSSEMSFGGGAYQDAIEENLYILSSYFHFRGEPLASLGGSIRAGC